MVTKVTILLNLRKRFRKILCWSVFVAHELGDLLVE